MMRIRSASSSASSRCWELMMMDLPTLILLISSQTCLLDSTSRPEVGSSRMMTRGLVTMAIARESFLFMPPDSWLMSLYWCSVSITTRRVSSIVDSTWLEGMFLRSQMRLRCSLTVRLS
mmetsp:Transcript_17873/g.30367  ORF Transcript_17873/g.30367 Transcript_17873/m.30367 type:complete len:119 (-) Transcript_17873:1232-1588(-)